MRAPPGAGSRCAGYSLSQDRRSTTCLASIACAHTQSASRLIAAVETSVRRIRPISATRALNTRRYLAGSKKSHAPQTRSEEHTSELQSLMRISYDVFCLKKKKQ